MVEFDSFRGLFAVFIHFQDDYCLFFQNKMSKCKSILYKDDQNYQKMGQRNQVQVRNSRDDTCHRSSDIYHATIIKHSQDLNVDISGALLRLGYIESLHWVLSTSRYCQCLFGILGAHRPEAVSLHKRSAPAYSLGKRHSNFMRILMV